MRWIIAGIALFVLLGAARFIYGTLNAATPVDIVRVRAAAPVAGGEGNVILNATGYIVAAHKIELAAKVIGKVAWIGVDKGDKVKAGQVLVRLEDDEYRARLIEAQGNLDTLKARLAQAEHGSRPEEIAKAKADVDQARADQENARVTLERTRTLVNDGVMAKQALDDAQARYDAAAAKVASFEHAYELVRLGPRKEEIDALRAQVNQAKGTLDYAQVQLDNTVIRAPVTGTILERNVEKGEFVTTGFVGDKGAKGYVVSLADLNDLEVGARHQSERFRKTRPAPARRRDHRRLSGSKIRRRDHRDFARGQPPEGHRAGEGEGPEAGWLSAAGDERQRRFLLRRISPAPSAPNRSRWSPCRPRRSATAASSWSSTGKPCAKPSRWPALTRSACRLPKA